MTAALRRSLAALALGFALTGGAAAFDASFQPIDVTVKPITAFRIGSTETKFGTLEFRGGLQLISADKRFGSLSGLEISPDGALLAVADTGFWFAGQLVEENGRPAGFKDGRIASMLDDNGNKLIGKNTFDAEGLRIVNRGTPKEYALVSFERANVVRRYVPSPDYAHARATRAKVPLAMGKANRNEGVEALAVAPAEGPLGGAMVLITEATLDANGNMQAWIVGGPQAGAFTVKRTYDFDVTDADFLPGGDLLILERRFNFATGVTMRIRRIAAGDLKKGAIVDGPVQIEANLAYEVDNMEGLSVRAGENGEAILDIISDDNQNRMLQRTILIRFALPAGAESALPESPVEASVEPTLLDANPVATPKVGNAAPIPRPRPRVLR